MKNINPEVEKIVIFCIKETGFNFRYDDWNNEYHKSHQLEIVSNLPKFQGMQIIFEDGIYEVSEYQAGIKGNELHVYKETKSLKIALKWFMKGNKQKPIKIWN